jgi:hypothetical protein
LSDYHFSSPKKTNKKTNQSRVWVSFNIIKYIPNILEYETINY